jgi:hypothetical protein
MIIKSVMVLPKLLAACCMLLGFLGPASAQTHPRLFFDGTSVAGFRAKANTAPWKDMLDAIEWNLERDLTGGYPGNRPFAHAMASLHLFRDSSAAPADYSEQAKKAVLWNISAPDSSNVTVWANSSYKSLTRAGRALGTAIAFDLCHGAWVGQTMPATFVAGNGVSYTVPSIYIGLDFNAAISLALKNHADALVASGGAEWPGDTKIGNNWFAVRYGAALLSYLACDETESGWSSNYNTCLSKLRTHLDANLTKRTDANGWNPEGIAYAQYPGYFMYPAAFALNRLKSVNLVSEFPAMTKALWSTYQGVLPIDRYSRTTAPNSPADGYGKGLRPDFTDDHNGWDPEGTAALAFAFAPPSHKPGMKWMFRRLCGDLGDRTWDCSTGNGLWSLLFYPDATPEANPSTVWGNTYADLSYGVFMFRNRFQDTDDFVMQTHGNLRPNVGGHYAADGLSFRIYGLGVPWTVGSGRTTDPRGQTTIFPSDPNSISNSGTRLVPSLVDHFLRQNGDGFTIMNMDTTEVGTSNHTRRIITDYSGASGAPGFFVISDSSNDGAFWRLNTPSFNTITTSGDRFTITSPDGQIMTGQVLWPLNPTFRTGTFARPPSFFYKTIGSAATGTPYSTTNKWVDFAGNGDGKFLVALTVTPIAAPVPAITATGSGVAQTISAGTRTIQVENNLINVNGWTRPVLTVTTPTANQQFNAGTTTVTVSGTLSDPDGLQKVDISLDGVFVGNANLNTTTGAWDYALNAVPVGAHSVSVDGVDTVNDRTTASVSFKVNNTPPPLVAITTPTHSSSISAEQNLVIQGTASDPGGSIALVEIFANGTKLGNATLNAAAGTWTYTWTRLPPGRHVVYALATDNTADFTPTNELTLLSSIRFANTNYGEGALWLMAKSTATGDGAPALNGTKRWSIREHDGQLRLLVRELKNFDYSHHQIYMRDTRDTPHWRMSYKYKIKADPSTPGYVPYSWMHFGAGVAGPVVMDLRPTNGVQQPNSYTNTTIKGTRLWFFNNAGVRSEFDYGTNPHSPGEPGYPSAPEIDKAGMPGPGWHDVIAERVGRTLKTWVDGNLVIDADNAWIGTKGEVGLSNERNDPVDLGNACWFDDIEFTALDNTGTPLPAVAALTPVVTGPVANANLPVGNYTITGTSISGTSSVQVLLGSVVLGSATLAGNTWSITTSLALGNYAVMARAFDAAGIASDSVAVNFTVSATGGAAANAAPTITIATDPTATGGIGMTGAYADTDGSVVLVQIIKDSIPLGNATLTNGTWKFTAVGMPSGTLNFIARATDNLGATADSTVYSIVWDGNTAPTITNISDQSTPQDTVKSGVNFTITDVETNTASLVITATSSNQTLLPNANIVIGGTGGSRNLTLTPATGQSGLATVTVTVSDGAKTATDTFLLTVTAPQVATSATITPSSASVALNATQTFTASLRDQFGLAMAAQPAWTWSVTGGGTINTTGVFTAGAVIGGPFSVTANSGSFTATATVNVITAPIATSVLVTPNAATVFPSATQTYVASLRDQNGNAMPSQPAWTWNVTGGGTISTGGVFTASSAVGGPYTVTATGNSLSGTALVSVGIAPPAAGNTTVVHWFGNYVSTNVAMIASQTLNDQDLDGDGNPWDAYRRIPWSTTTALTPTANYAGSSSRFYGGINLRAFGTSSTTKAALPSIADGFVQNHGGSTSTSASPVPTDDAFGFRFQSAFNVGWNFAAVWLKPDFLNGGDGPNNVTFGAGSRLELSVGDVGANTNLRWDAVQTGRWLVRDGSQWYVSQTATSNGSSDKLLTFSIATNDGLWAPVDPATAPNLNLDLAAAIYAAQNFINITGIGFYLENDLATGTSAANARVWWYVDQFRADAVLAAPLTPYQQFSAATWPENTPESTTAPDADPDADGLVNLVEYALGLDPKVGSGLPSAELINDEQDQPHLQIKFTRPIGRNDVTVTGQFSHDLKAENWSQDNLEVATLIEAGATTETIIIRDLRPLGDTDRRFLRALVTMP